MKKILFTHSYFYRFDRKQWKAKQPYPPLGTIYAAAVLREAGYQVSLFDTALAESPEEIIPVLDKEKPDYLVIYDDGFNYLTKMCLTNMREAAFRMSEIAKEKGCKVIVNSSDSTDHYEKYLDHKADFIIIGEGEITLKELMDRNCEGPNNIDGLVFRENEKNVFTNKRTVLTDLDSLPMPAWDLVNIDSYN